MAAAITEADLKEGRCYTMTLDNGATHYLGKYYGIKTIKTRHITVGGKTEEIEVHQFPNRESKWGGGVSTNIPIGHFTKYNIILTEVECKTTGGRRSKSKTSKMRSKKARTNKKYRKH
jgi:hypothetical protein